MYSLFSMYLITRFWLLKKKIPSRVRLETQRAITSSRPASLLRYSSFDADSAPLRPARVHLDNEDPLAPSSSLSLLVHAWIVPYRIKSLLAHLVFPLSHSDLPYILTSIGTLSRFITGVLSGSEAKRARAAWEPGATLGRCRPSAGAILTESIHERQDTGDSIGETKV